MWKSGRLGGKGVGGGNGVKENTLGKKKKGKLKYVWTAAILGRRMGGYTKRKNRLEVRRREGGKCMKYRGRE